MDAIAATVQELANHADDIVINRRETSIKTSGEYKDARQPDFREALEEVDLEEAIANIFTADELRFGDIRLPKDISNRMRYLLAKNLAKEAAKQLAINGSRAVKDWMRGRVYAALTEKLTKQLLED